jgi:hypothetical protein
MQDYWKEYYTRKIEGDSPLVHDPSSFALMVSRYIQAGSSIIDLGAGNGRDTSFFKSLGLESCACDSVDNSEQINALGVRFICRSMDMIEDGIEFDSAYSRFSLHSITRDQQERVFSWVHRNCKDRFFIETRSVHDPRFGKGEQVGENEFVDTHYRRFTTLDELIFSAKRNGFEVEHASVDFTSSWFKDDKAVVNRLVLRKIK